MKKQFVTFEIAKALTEIGFNEPVLAVIDEEGDIIIEEVRYKNQIAKGWIKAPLWQQAVKWLNAYGANNHLNIYVSYNGFNLSEIEILINQAVKLIKQ